MSLASVLGWLGVMLVFLTMNFLFVAAEYALVKLRKTRVQEMVDSGHQGARTVQRMQQKMASTIAGTQLGITLASLALGWVGENSIHETLKYVFSLTGITWTEPSWFAFAASYVLLTMLHVIVGEQVPKSIALRMPEKVALVLAAPLRLFCFLASPLVWVMTVLSTGVLKLVGIPEAPPSEFPVHSADELEYLIEASHKAGKLGANEGDLLKRALELKKSCIKDVMVPRTKMDYVADTISLAELLEVVSKTKHSKLPVFKGNRDNMVGVLYVRDLLDRWQQAMKSQSGSVTVADLAKDFRIEQYVRHGHVVPESMPSSNLLDEMRQQQYQMAIVVDEYGGTTGLITLEDLLEELVGEIWDEYDNPKADFEQLGADHWKLSGQMTLLEFNRAIGVEVGCATCSTVAGAMIEVLDRQPQVGDKVVMNGLEFTVLEIDRNAITKVELRKVKADPVVPPGENTTT